jgi:sugar/nucleoside kinase (ribokinase family)
VNSTAQPPRATHPQVTVAGHICLDVIPQFPPDIRPLSERLLPGALIEIGPAVLSTGGVSNTGLALHRLGVTTRLMNKVGDDLFGELVLGLLRRHDPELASGMIVTPGVQTSYSLVLNPPGYDRTFLHCSGANDTLSADDIAYDQVAQAPVFHFGYPPILRRFYANDGAELERMLRAVKVRGVITSLDTSLPDPNSPAGQVNWRAVLKRALPHVDIFLPSLDEMLFMLGHAPGPNAFARPRLAEIAGELLDMGARVVGLKLGDRGLYVRTTENHSALAALERSGNPRLDTWRGRELLAPCFRVQVAGTTGCGDCTIAGFLAGLLNGLTLDDTVTAATAVGAFCAEQPDATSGVPHWTEVQARIAAGWERLA